MPKGIEGIHGSDTVLYGIAVMHTVVKTIYIEERIQMQAWESLNASLDVHKLQTCVS